MVYSFAVTSAEFEEEFTSLLQNQYNEVAQEFIDAFLADKINNKCNNSRNNTNDPDKVFEDYDEFNLDIQNYISLPQGEVYAICLAADIYHSKVSFISELISNGTNTKYELPKELHRGMFLHFEFSKMYANLKLIDCTMIDDDLSTVVFSVKSIKTCFNKNDDPIYDNGFSISKALCTIAKYYYSGIDGYLFPNIKIAIYYMFIAYYLLKNSDEPVESRKTYSDLLDMYINAVDNNHEVDLTINSFNKLKKLDVTEVEQIEQRNSYIAMKVILTHKTVLIASDPTYVSKYCMGCGATQKLKKCAKCRIARFCSMDCIRSSWTEHKPYCNRWAITE
jgi:hypothetical protein